MPSPPLAAEDDSTRSKIFPGLEEAGRTDIRRQRMSIVPASRFQASSTQGSIPNLVIIISGPHGSGKTTYAKAIAEKLGLRLVSAGDLFRQIARERGLTIEGLSELAKRDSSIDRHVDNRIKREAERGSVVLDGHLASWIVGERADVRIYLRAPEGVRARRIAERDSIPLEEARRLMRRIERDEAERWKRLYGINVADLSVYDLVLNTDLLPVNANVEILLSIIKRIAGQGSKKWQSR